MNSFSFKQYDRIEDLVNGGEWIPVFEYVDSEGNTGEIDGTQALVHIAETGTWGYIDHETRVIHFWFDQGVIAFHDLVSFFGHEIGHVISKEPLEENDGLMVPTGDSTDMSDEIIADGYGLAASEAYRLASLAWEGFPDLKDDE